MAAKKKIPSPAKNKPKSGIKKSTSSVGKQPAAAGRTRTTARKKPAATGKKRRHSSQKMTEEMLYYIKRVRFIRGIVLLCLTLLLTLLFFMTGENIWQALHNCYLGVFGFSGILLPVLLLYCAVQMFRERSTYRLPLKILFLSGTIFMLATTVYAFSSSGMELKEYGTELVNCYHNGYLSNGAGFIGGLLGIPLAKFFGAVAGGILSTIFFLLLLYMSFEALFINVIDKIKEPVSERISEHREIREKVRQETVKIKAENRQRAHEEYVNRKVTEKVAAVKRKNDNPDYRRITKTPIYDPSTALQPAAPTPSSSRIDYVGIKGVVPSVAPKKNKQTDASEEPFPVRIHTSADSDDTIDIAALLEQSRLSSAPPPTSYDDAIKTVFGTHPTLDAPIKTPAKVKPSPAAAKPARPPAAPTPSPVLKPSPAPSPSHKVNLSKSDTPEPDKKTAGSVNLSKSNPNPIVEGQYIKPPFILLEPPQDEPEENITQELHQCATKLVDTLKSFGVPTTILNISRGPSVTRYELVPASGIKISKITNLADDIAMNLAATGVRIEAPIPGKNAVGIEVPNKYVSLVKMRTLVESMDFQNAKSKLTVALGEDITGHITLADLSKMPHLLIAGSTGSGKSVCINAMLISLLYKASPDEVKLILIDPKVVELGVYNGIPHLLVPVVTDPRKAAGALDWAVNRMLERYKTFAEYNVRDIYSYNRLVDKQNAELEEGEQDEADRTFEENEMLAQAQAELAQNADENPPEKKHKLEKMCHIVIVIDELADLMMAAPNEVEESICRLAQMARAAGMHLVIATQRPSVDVITGLIKANVPSRIAFAVKSQIDSRTILDTGGADKLLGKGDMLFSPIGTTKPIRVQGCYVNDDEIESIIKFIKENKVVEYDKNIIDEIEASAIAEHGGKSSDNDDSDSNDPMMEQAIQCVVEAGQASTSLLQRRLRLGYARAGRLIDEMEQMGIVGPHEGSKPRQVLMTYQQWLERSMTVKDTE